MASRQRQTTIPSRSELRLERVTIQRMINGHWIITRERRESGEKAGPYPTLKEALGFVQRIYDDNGEIKPEQLEMFR
jgi:hypothetical protein